MNWVPIDCLAKVLVEVALAEPDVGCRVGSDVSVIHPHNLYPTSWECFLPTIFSALVSIGHGTAIETVPFRTWVRRVHEDLEDPSRERDFKDEDLERLLELNPAAKLLDFFRDQIDVPEKEGLETKAAERMSSKLRALGPVNSQWMERWVKAWFG